MMQRNAYHIPPTGTIKQLLSGQQLRQGTIISLANFHLGWPQEYMLMTSTAPPTTLIRDLYTRMLFTRIVDDYAQSLYKEGRINFNASCHGHEAAQVGS